RFLRWARLKLPNGQIARSLWKETSISLKNIRQARCVKVKIDGIICFAEVQFYFCMTVLKELKAVALIRLY
ncbi:hypothetical protein M422DRAFT_104374, partial [Sphaerobolus stellatus SS14]